MAGKKDPRSERAMRAALKLVETREAVLSFMPGEEYYLLQARANRPGEELLAIFDLRDCFRKRRALTGIGKRLAKAVRTGK